MTQENRNIQKFTKSAQFHWYLCSHAFTIYYFETSQTLSTGCHHFIGHATITITMPVVPPGDYFGHYHPPRNPSGVHTPSFIKIGWCNQVKGLPLQWVILHNRQPLSYSLGSLHSPTKQPWLALVVSVQVVLVWTFAVMGDAKTAVITLLTNALKALAAYPSTTLVTSAFDWNSTEQILRFPTFYKICEKLVHTSKYCEGGKRWFHQNWLYKTGVCTKFLGIKDGKNLEMMTKWGRQRQMLTNSWIISFLWWTMKCHSIAGFINWKMSGYGQENHPMSSWNACVPWLTTATFRPMMKRM